METRCLPGGLELHKILSKRKRHGGRSTRFQYPKHLTEHVDQFLNNENGVESKGLPEAPVIERNSAVGVATNSAVPSAIAPAFLFDAIFSIVSETSAPATNPSLANPANYQILTPLPNPTSVRSSVG